MKLRAFYYLVTQVTVRGKIGEKSRYSAIQ